jgi:GH15 family glucan-1,4-alpha-glucosidase
MDTLWAGHAGDARAVLARAAPVLSGDVTGFDPRLAPVIERAVLVLRSILREDGAPMGGIHCYQNVGQVRNGSYILNVLDQLGFHEATRGGYEFYLNFRVGDDRYSSPDENDQLGTVLHVLRRRLDLTGDLALIEQHRDKILAMADRLIGLIDARLGLIYSERAIHEYVAISRGYETYVNTMAWRGLVDAAHLAGVLGEAAAASRFQAAADTLRARVMQHLVDPEHGVFVKRLYRGRHYPLPAISMIAPALFGLVDAADPVVTRTMAYMKEANWDRQIGGLYRYPLHHQPWPEHPYGGPWVTYTCWLGGVHVRRGERAAAAACIRWVLDQLPVDSHLIAEHFSVQHIGRRGYARIYLDPATPEVWATAEFLRLVLAYFHGDAPDKPVV